MEQKIPLTPSEVRAAHVRLMQAALMVSTVKIISRVMLSGEKPTKEAVLALSSGSGFADTARMTAAIAREFNYGDDFRDEVGAVLNELMEAMLKALDGDGSDYVKLVREKGGIDPNDPMIGRMEAMVAKRRAQKEGAAGSA